MIVYIYNIGVDLYNGFNGLRHRINWTYFTVLDGLAHPLYSNRIIFVELDTVLTSKLTQNQSFTQHKIKESSTKRILLTQYMF